MFTSIGMRRLRGVKELQIDGLRRINIIVGRNNAGKSTVLEAMFLLGGATNPIFATTLGQLRGQRLGASYPDALWRPLFCHMNPHQPIEIWGHHDGEVASRHLTIEALNVSSYSEELEGSAGGAGGGVAAATQEFVIGGLRLRYVPAAGTEIVTEAVFDPRSGNVNAPSRDREDFVRTAYLSARAYGLTRDAQQFSSLLKRKKEQDVLEGVQIIDSRAKRIEVLTESGGPAVYVDVGLDSLLPLAVCGEGFVRLFSLVVELTSSRHGTLLVDEIDNGLHYAAMPKLWRLLRELTRKHDVQVLATTHNEEIVDGALREFANAQDAIGLFRIDRSDSEHRVVSYDSVAQEAVTVEGFEVRG